MTAAVTTTECGTCGLDVAATREGGDRPRDHHNPAGKPCTGGIDTFVLRPCARCGKPARGDASACTSGAYHPETWTDEQGRNVGNAAAAGEIVRVSGPDYQWLARTPPAGPRRAPAHVGIRLDGLRFYDLDAVREYARNRPGQGGNGSPGR